MRQKFHEFIQFQAKLDAKQRKELVGGFSPTHLKNMIQYKYSQIGSSFQGEGVKTKNNIWNLYLWSSPPPRMSQGSKTKMSGMSCQQTFLTILLQWFLQKGKEKWGCWKGLPSSPNFLAKKPPSSMFTSDDIYGLGVCNSFCLCMAVAHDSPMIWMSAWDRDNSPTIRSSYVISHCCQSYMNLILYIVVLFMWFCKFPIYSPATRKNKFKIKATACTTCPCHFSIVLCI